MNAADLVKLKYNVQRPGFALDVALDIPMRGITGIFGASGAGKTTLLRCIAGLETAQSGDLIVAGERWQDENLSRAPYDRNIGYVFQEPRLFRHLDVRANIEYGMRRGASDDGPKFGAIVELLGLDSLLERQPDELSGGEAQRVAIARALVLGPKVLICDEAVAALDGSVREQVLALLRNIQKETGLSIIFIAHDLAVVRAISHRVLVMYLGRLVELADNAALFARPRHPYTRALIDAVPIPDPVVPRNKAPLRGEVPSLLHPPGGCVFHPRCEYAIDICATKLPVARDLEGTRVACHRADEVDFSR